MIIKKLLKRKIKKAVAESIVDGFNLLKSIIKSTTVSYDSKTGEITIEAKVKKEW